MNILITGGAGFIGSHLCQKHLHENDRVFVVDNLITGSKKNIEPFLDSEKFRFFSEDICKFDFSILPRCQIIYHLASPASPEQYKRYPVETSLTNSYGTFRVLEFFKQNKTGCFFLASTSETYGDPHVHPQPETYWGNVNPIGPRSCYDEGKRFAESLTMTYYRKYGLDVRVARIFNTYGPNMEKNDGRAVSNFIMQALTQKPITIFGNGNQTRSFAYVSDTVEGLYRLAHNEKASGEVVNIGNPVEKKVIELARMVKKLTESKSPIEFQPSQEDDPQKRQPDISKAKSLLGWKPLVSLEKGLENTIHYFKERFL